ncbi:MAG TPA: hypothetical protein VK658_08285 [Chryseolinea sp.]|nr:hypothetical protein [Chryseolinea sp.]
MTENTFRNTVFGKILDVAVVIVGITIAFQVDRWKENSDRTSREESYLQGIMADLDKDIKEYQDNMEDLNRDRELIYRSLTRLTRAEDISDSLGFVVMAVLRSRTFEGHNNTYTTIMTGDGIDILSNGDVRELVIEHYRLYSSLSKFEVRYMDLLAQFKVFFTPYVYFNRSGKLLNKGIARDIQTENLLTLAAIQQQEGVFRYKGSLEKAVELREQIEAALD